MGFRVQRVLPPRYQQRAIGKYPFGIDDVAGDKRRILPDRGKPGCPSTLGVRSNIAASSNPLLLGKRLIRQT